MSAPRARSDRALAIIKAGLSAVPVVGGPIANLIGDYVPTSTQRSIQRSVELLRRRLEDFGDRIDASSVDKDEFTELFKSCYLTIVRTHQKSKLRAATALLANILLRDGDPDKLSYTELDHYARCLDSLSVGAISALGHAVVLASQSTHNRFNFEDLQRRMAPIAADLLIGLVGELHAVNLVHLVGAPTIRTAEYRNYPVQVTQLGARFVGHLLYEPGQDDGNPT